MKSSPETFQFDPVSAEEASDDGGELQEGVLTAPDLWSRWEVRHEQGHQTFNF